MDGAGSEVVRLSRGSIDPRIFVLQGQADLDPAARLRDADQGGGDHQPRLEGERGAAEDADVITLLELVGRQAALAQERVRGPQLCQTMGVGDAGRVGIAADRVGAGGPKSSSSRPAG